MCVGRPVVTKFSTSCGRGYTKREARIDPEAYKCPGLPVVTGDRLKGGGIHAGKGEG